MSTRCAADHAAAALLPTGLLKGVQQAGHAAAHLRGTSSAAAAGSSTPCSSTASAATCAAAAAAAGAPVEPPRPAVVAQLHTAWAQAAPEVCNQVLVQATAAQDMLGWTGTAWVLTACMAAAGPCLLGTYTLPLCRVSPVASHVHRPAHASRLTRRAVGMPCSRSAQPTTCRL